MRSLRSPYKISTSCIFESGFPLVELSGSGFQPHRAFPARELRNPSPLETIFAGQDHCGLIPSGEFPIAKDHSIDFLNVGFHSGPRTAWGVFLLR